ncbi:MAG: cytidine deaminase [Armatimonadota bacterium]
MNLPPEAQQMIQRARAVRRCAYAPYSGYAVGACVQTPDDQLFTGCNVENASYGLSICAERTALFRAIAEGAQLITAVAVVTPDGGTPCGACRQVLAEFATNPETCLIWVATPDHIVGVYRLAELLPYAFQLVR